MSPSGSSRVRVVATDTNILINLIHVGLLDLLATLPPYSFVVPEEVVNEVSDSEILSPRTPTDSGRVATRDVFTDAAGAGAHYILTPFGEQ